MVYFPCLHVTGHIPIASRANVNIRFFRHNAVLHRKLVPTDCPMVYSPCLHVTRHIPFASGANINILFRNDLRVPYLETLTTCAPVIYLARAYTARHRLLASGTNILETLAFLLCFCFICQQRHRLRRAAIVLLFAAPFCLPVCASFCSVVFSTLLRVRRGFLQLGDILVSFLFSFHAGSPDISRRLPGPPPSSGVVVFTTYTYRTFCSDFCSVLLSPMFCLRLCFLRSCPLVRFRSAMASQTSAMARAAFSSASFLATFACVAATRCTALLMLPREMTQFQQFLQTWSPLHERCCASQRSKANAPCFTWHMLHLNQPHAFPEQAKHTLLPLRARFHIAAEKLSFRPCGYCRHYTVVSVRTSHKYGKMWLVGLHVLPWMHLPASRPCMPCIARAAAPQGADECILCILSQHLRVSSDQPWMQKPALIHYILCIVFHLGISLAARSNPFFHHPSTATAIPALLLRLFETVLQGTVCTETNHACLGPALTQCRRSMGRLLRQCACPWQPLLCKFALGLRGRWSQTLEPMGTASVWRGVLAAFAPCPNTMVSSAARQEKLCLRQSPRYARWSWSWSGPRYTPATYSKSVSLLHWPPRWHRPAKPSQQSPQHIHVKFHGCDPSDLQQPLAYQGTVAKHRTKTHSPDRVAAATLIFLCRDLAFRAKPCLRSCLLQWRGAAPVLFLRPKLLLALYSHDTSLHLWRK